MLVLADVFLNTTQGSWTDLGVGMKNHGCLQFARWACLAVALGMVTSLGSAQSAPKGDEGQILALENAWNHAEVEHDPAALELILTDDFVITEPDGTLQTKRDHMAATKDASYHYDLLVSEDFRIRLYGTVAVVTGSYHEKGSAKGSHFDRRGRFTDTWIKLGPTWRCVASHDSLPVKG
jgi:ketosteroid isomerase-like protein